MMVLLLAAVLEENLQNAASQMEINQISFELYQLWDDELNAVWKTLKEVLLPVAEKRLFLGIMKCLITKNA